MLKQPFIKFMLASNVERSGKASSYVRALDLLSEMLQVCSFGFDDCIDIWSVTSVRRLESLFECTSTQKRAEAKSPWFQTNLPKSYLKSGFCNAALSSFIEFIISHQYEKLVFNTFESNTDTEDTLAHKLTEHELIPSSQMIEGLSKQEGKEAIRIVKSRCNQNVFRKIILSIYNDSCCITGLNIPQVNRASHIIPWAKNESTRLDPRNGLCLSATYDAAFDRNLISLDEDYKVILSKDIKEHYTNQAAKEHFHSIEGQTITLPSRYLPHQEYLAEHRAAGSF